MRLTLSQALFASAACSLLLSPAIAGAQAGNDDPAWSIEKPRQTRISLGYSQDLIEVKFRNADRTAPGKAGWTSRHSGALPRLDALTAADGPVLRVTPLFSADVVHDTSHRVDLPALGQWYRMQLKAGQDAAAIIDLLNGMDAVEIAYAAPLPAPPPSVARAPATVQWASPLFVERQGYALAAPNGIDAVHARTVPGGDGTGIRVVDIEYSWNWQHEDLTKLRVPGTWIKQGASISDPFNDNNHGTSVLGEMIADDNGFGVRGLVSGATPHYVNVTSPQTGYNPANAVALAAAKLAPGDVILIEQQFPGPAPCNGYVAPEWIPSIYDAVVSAVRRGIHVVETAGNGNVNLDAGCFGPGFPRGRPDSGAILAGAGGAAATQWCRDSVVPRSRLGFSTHGRRVNLQGWGGCVATTGGRDLYSGGPNASYTQRFNGTSSAGPIVASAVAAVSGAAKARGTSLTPLQMRSLLVETGTPQVGNNGHIGPLPNLRAALDRLAGMP